MQEEPMEGSQAPHLSTRDSDSDEGILAPGSNGQAFNPHEAPTPTAEEGEYCAHYPYIPYTPITTIE